MVNLKQKIGIGQGLLCLHNFIGESPEKLLEHLVELSLYTEENLK